ncbi:MAG: polysaccharide biosynthesis tyrosine autokinase [Cyclobacteriaceae bacterium]|nr:polysaccharide biosynthesis tyrosine autokinase [Cyclobacteriaceae bacterium]
MLDIDYKRVLFRALRLWYLVALSLLVALTVAYLINRYTTRIYPVTASIIIREPAENTDARFLYNNPLVNAYRNFYNEPYIIRSYPLLQEVVEALNFQVTIQKEGNIKVVEQYTLPFDIAVLSNGRSSEILLEVMSVGTVRCYTEDNKTNDVFQFNEPITCGGVTFKVIPQGDVSRIIGEQFKVYIRDPEAVAVAYSNQLKVSWAQQGSSVVNLDINGPIPQKGIDFLNKLIEVYHRYDLEKKSQAASRSLLFIETQLQDIGDSLRLYESALENFKRKNFVTDLSAEAQQLYEQLKVLGEQRAVVVFATNYYDYLEKYLKRSSDYSQVVLPTSIGITDGVISALTNQLVTIQNEFNLLPLAKDLQNPMLTEKSRQLKNALTEIRQQLLEAISGLRATDKIRQRGIDQQINHIEVQLRALPKAERALVNIQRKYTFSENLYNYLQQKKAEAGISKASTTSDIVVVNPPRQAGSAITPKVMQNYATFGAIGFILPLLGFVLVEVFNNRVQSKEDIEKVTAIPFIGGIGHNPSEKSLVVFEKPKSALAESFRALRSNLNYFTEGKDKKVFMITSSLSGEGKSFTTINLATVFSLAGKRTLIIGADLRKPKIFDDFGLGNEKGLSVYLSGLVSREEIIQSTAVPGLDIIGAGPVPPNPSELLLHARMDELIAWLKETYDFILIDTPPLAIITDGLVLAKYADHTVFIVRQNYTPRPVLKMVDELYINGKIKNLSMVLNDVYRSGPGYGYGGYGYGGYGYGYAYGYGYGYRDKKGNGGGYYSED